MRNKTKSKAPVPMPAFVVLSMAHVMVWHEPAQELLFDSKNMILNDDRGQCATARKGRTF